MTENDRERAGGPEIATGTLAEIYAQQGLHARALEIYRRIALRSPSDDRVAARIAELERAVAAGDDGEGGVALPTAGPDDPETGAPEPDPEEAPRAAPAAAPAAGDEAFLEWLRRR
ncbi:MAG TPA: hypothetical protein VM778_05575 [Gemmatimonadota bacterium]|nr:hypothetical protein [Gemmatimonadota bacterium]